MLLLPLHGRWTRPAYDLQHKASAHRHRSARIDAVDSVQPEKRCGTGHHQFIITVDPNRRCLSRNAVAGLSRIRNHSERGAHTTVQLDGRLDLANCSQMKQPQLRFAPIGRNSPVLLGDGGSRFVHRLAMRKLLVDDQQRFGGCRVCVCIRRNRRDPLKHDAHIRFDRIGHWARRHRERQQQRWWCWRWPRVAPQRCTSTTARHQPSDGRAGPGALRCCYIYYLDYLDY